MTDADGICRGRAHHRLSSLRRDLDLDIKRVAEASAVIDAPGRVSFLKRLSLLLTPQVLSVLLYRISHLLHVRSWRRTARLVADVNSIVHKATISPESCISGGLFLPHPVGVAFHGRAGSRLTVYHCGLCASLEPERWSAIDDGPSLGDRVTLGGHAGVHGPVKVGDDTTVAFRADLRTDAPERSIVVSRSMYVSRKQHTRAGSNPA